MRTDAEVVRRQQVVGVAIAAVMVLLSALVALPVGAAAPRFRRERHPTTTTIVTTTTNAATTTTVAAASTTTTTLPPSSDVAPPAPNSTGTYLFDDEFNGSGLDLSKWQPNWLGPNNTAITKPVNSSELSCYDPAQVGVSDGSLHLGAIARSCRANNGTTYPYASGLVNTLGRFSFTYGHLEARVWVPSGAGAVTDWPAFWADGSGAWPTTGENDVFEGLSGKDCFHFHSTSGGPGSCAPAANPSGWHVFAADWSPGLVTYRYDGIVVGSITTGITGAPMYLILNLGVGGSGGAMQAPATMLVDYVRVWQT